jgi:triosephosphate isomerase
MTLSLTTPRPLIAGNWKMFGLEASLDEARTVAAALAAKPPAARVAICPAATLLHRMADAMAGEAVIVGGQDCHSAVSGPHTGDISAAMLADAGARLVILGHSERRAAYGESDALVSAKVEAALAAGLEPIVCFGENLRAARRRTGRGGGHRHGPWFAAGQLLAGQAFAVAYEPVWAIGTGRTPTPADIAHVHEALRAVLVERFGEHGATVPILYGGSVKPDNAREILATPEVGGALVGGASLKAADFLAIIDAA